MSSTVRRILRWLLLLALLVVISLVGGPLLLRMREKTSSTSCLSNVKQIGVAMSQYAQDYEMHLPNALTWPSDLLPYYRNRQILHCPQDPRGRDKRCYRMMQALSYQPLPEKEAYRILLYEIGDYGIEYRHRKGMYLCLCDGHAKWYSQQDIPPEVILSGVVKEPEP